MKRIDGIDITRGLLALSVAIYHYVQFLDLGSLKRIHALITAGIASVDGFFMISGFALFYSYNKIDFTKTINIGVYFLNRFARIAPLFYLCMLLNIASESTILIIISLLLLLGLIEYKKNAHLMKYFFLLIVTSILTILLTPLSSSYEKIMMLNNLFFFFGFINTNLTQVRGGWSIGIECIFYFALPFIICLTKNNTKYLTAVALFTIFLAIDYQLLNDTNLYSYNSNIHAQQLVTNSVRGKPLVLLVDS